MTEKHDSLKRAIGTSLRDASLKQLAQFTAKTDLVISEIDDSFRLGQVLNDQMIILVISGEDIRMTVKIHYKLSDTRKFAKVPFTAYKGQTHDNELTDYMKELANQVCGRICRAFAQQGIDLGMSIPLRVRGFYEVYADYDESDNPLVKFGDFWQIKNDTGTMFFSCYNEIANSTAFQSFCEEGIEDETNDDDDEGLEFL